MADISAPAGTILDLAARWVEGPITYRPSATVTVQSSTGFKVQGLNGTGAAPTVTVGAGAGTGATVTGRVGWDVGGSFVLNAGTTPAGGILATVTFGTPLPTAPVSVVVSAGNSTAAATSDISVGAISLSTTGFTIQGSAPAASPATYVISYQVVAS